MRETNDLEVMLTAHGALLEYLFAIVAQLEGDPLASLATIRGVATRIGGNTTARGATSEELARIRAEMEDFMTRFFDRVEDRIRNRPM